MQNNTHIAIVSDGNTDFEILKTLIKEVVFSESAIEIPDDNFIAVYEKTGIKIDGAIKEYLKNADKTQKRGIYDEPATKLKNKIILVLKRVVSEIENRFYISTGSFSHCDLLILNDDSDKKLTTSKDFLDEWAYSVISIFYLAVQEFYEEKINHGHTFRYLPIIFPLIFFPSTEILVAAFRYNNNFEHYRNQDAPTLKQMLYGTNNLNTLQEDELGELALKFINSTLLEQVFAKLPEIRVFLHQIIVSIK